MKYRSEIDGLRAVAALPVIFFHAGFSLFSGGYVGVDIFFVISGYLITFILIEDIENKQFSLLKFYERRARRILPALFLVMAACIPFAWFLMPPDQMQGFAKSLIAVSVFGSNFLFWKESGYFDTASEEKPLLHTWSLAVEEQFYLLFPILLLLIWRFGAGKTLFILVSLLLISLGGSEWGWRNSPSANFFLAPSRIWELFAGSVTAILVYRRGIIPNSLLSVIGLLAIFLSIIVYDQTTPFPSIFTLLPVIGTVCVIAFTSAGSIVHKILSSRLLVFIGLLSYSAYLWHQPVFAFARLYVIGELGTSIKIALVITTLALSYLTWKYIESPFRQNKIIQKPNVIFLLSFVFLSLFTVTGLWGHKISKRLKTETFAYRVLKQAESERQIAIKAGVCHFNKRGQHKDIDSFLKNWDCYSDNEKLIDSKIMLVGDSHSADKVIALKSVGYDVTQLAGAGCSIEPIYSPKGKAYCKKILAKAKSIANSDRVESVFLSSRFKTEDTTIEYLQATLEYWKDVDANIYIWSPMPDFTLQEEEFKKQVKTKAISQPNMERERHFYELLRKIKLPDNFQVIKTSDILCDVYQTIGCGFSFTSDNAELLMTDEDHLSVKGARFFGRALIISDQLKGMFINKN
ncbi:MAG: acyltransferase family protein [Neptuniibacter sp.]